MIPGKTVASKKNLAEKAFSVKGMTGKFAMGNGRIFLFSSIDPTQRPHASTKRCSTLTVRSNTHQTVRSARTGTFFPRTFFSRGPFFTETCFPETFFPGYFFSGDFFPGTFIRGFFYSRGPFFRDSDVKLESELKKNYKNFQYRTT